MPKQSGLPPRTTPTVNDYVTGYETTGPTAVRFKIQDLRPLFAVKRQAANVTTATLTPNVATDDFITVSALAGNLSVAAHTGTAVDGQVITLRIRDDGTARTITWNAIYRGIGVTLPTTTTAGKIMYISMIYNIDDAKWDIVSVGRQG